jgi:hypothetical protein
MSAYVVDNKCIDILVFAIVDKYELDVDVPAAHGIIIDVNKMRDQVGQALLDENYRSVNYRYGENTAPRAYAYMEPDHKIDGRDILDAIDEYEYQSCETNDWQESDQYKWLLKIQSAMLQRYVAQERAKNLG